MKHNKSHLKQVISVVTAIFVFIGCATPAKPIKTEDIKKYDVNRPAVVQQFYDFHPQIGWHIEKLPDVKDGLTLNEKQALKSMHSHLQGESFPEELFGKVSVESRNYLLVTWEGKSDKPTKVDGRISFIDGTYRAPTGGVIEAVSTNFEKGDQYNIDKKMIFPFTFESTTKKGDRDSLLLKIRYPKDRIEVAVNNSYKMPNIYKKDILAEKVYKFEDDDVILTITDGNLRIYSPVQTAIQQFSSMGHKTHSAGYEAWLWKELENQAEGDDENPLKDFKDYFVFVTDVWGGMETKEWENSKEVMKRANTGDLIYYIAVVSPKRFNYVYYDGGHYSNNQTWKNKKGNCVDISEWVVEALKTQGYRAGTFNYDAATDRHRIAYYYKDNKIFTIDAGSTNPIEPRGPFESFFKMPYRNLEVK